MGSSLLDRGPSTRQRRCTLSLLELVCHHTAPHRIVQPRNFPVLPCPVHPKSSKFPSSQKHTQHHLICRHHVRRPLPRRNRLNVPQRRRPIPLGRRHGAFQNHPPSLVVHRMDQRRRANNAHSVSGARGRTAAAGASLRQQPQRVRAAAVAGDAVLRSSAGIRVGHQRVWGESLGGNE